MEVVDPKIAAAFLDLSNFFAEKNGFQTISSLVNLWNEHGKLITNLMEIESNDIKTSSDFYNSLFRKLKIISLSLAEGLDPENAANGNLMEICKFYSLHLEYLRNMQPEMLKKVLEHLAKNKKFNNDALLHMFEVFDKLYEEDCADDWWSFMRVEEKISFIGLATPTVKRQQSLFTTPTASTRRMQNIANSAKRSPIVDIVDSPTMKFVRAERELKQFTKKLNEIEIKLEEAENENSMLLKENRDLKTRIADHRINVENDRFDVQKAEQQIDEYSKKLELKTLENECLSNELTEFRLIIRASQRQIEALDKEKNQMSEKLNALTKDKENMLKSLRETRESNEAEYNKWQQSEQELIKQTKLLSSDRERLVDCFSNAETTIAELTKELKKKEDIIEQKDLDLCWSKKNEEKLEEEKEREIKNYKELLESLKAQKNLEIEREKARAKMAETTIERLTTELQSEKDEKNMLKTLLKSFEQTNLKENVTEHEEKEGYLKAMSSLTASKSKITILEAEVSGKEVLISSLKSQLENVYSVLEREQSISKDAERQSTTTIKILEDQLQKVKMDFDKELTKSREDLEIIQTKYLESEAKYECDVVLMKKQVDEQKQKIEELEKKNEELEANKCEMISKIAYFEGLVGGSRRRYSFSSTDSLFDAIDKELKKDENIVPEYKDTTRKSIAFSIDMDLRNQMPPGFRLDSAQKESATSLNRFSIADETFERGKLDRTSIRSDCASSIKSSNFKQPFEPLETDNNLNSSSDQQGNLKMTINEKRKKLRTSLSAFSNVFGRK